MNLPIAHQPIAASQLEERHATHLLDLKHLVQQVFQLGAESRHGAAVVGITPACLDLQRTKPTSNPRAAHLSAPGQCICVAQDREGSVNLA